MAVEADWPDAYRVNRYVRGRGDDAEADRRAGGLPALPDLDVAQRRRARFRRLAPRPQRRGRPGEPQGRLLRPGPLQPARLDGGRARLPRQGRPRGGRAGAPPLRLLRPLRRGPPGVRLRRRARNWASPARTRWSPSSSTCSRHAAEYARRDGRIAEDDYFYAEQNARLVRNAEQYYRTMFRGEVSSWNLRDRHMAETLDALVDFLERNGDGREGRRLGAQLAPGRRPGDGDGRARRVERRPARARAVRPRRGPRRVHHLRRHGDGGLELGRAGRAEARPPGPAGELRGPVPRRRPRAVPADAPRRAGCRAWPSRGSSAPSA